MPKKIKDNLENVAKDILQLLLTQKEKTLSVLKEVQKRYNLEGSYTLTKWLYAAFRLRTEELSNLEKSIIGAQSPYHHLEAFTTFLTKIAGISNIFMIQELAKTSSYAEEDDTFDEDRLGKLFSEHTPKIINQHLDQLVKDLIFYLENPRKELIYELISPHINDITDKDGSYYILKQIVDFLENIQEKTPEERVFLLGELLKNKPPFNEITTDTINTSVYYPTDESLANKKILSLFPEKANQAIYQHLRELAENISESLFNMRNTEFLAKRFMDAKDSFSTKLKNCLPDIENNFELLNLFLDILQNKASNSSNIPDQTIFLGHLMRVSVKYREADEKLLPKGKYFLLFEHYLITHLHQGLDLAIQNRKACLIFSLINFLKNGKNKNDLITFLSNSRNIAFQKLSQILNNKNEKRSCLQIFHNFFTSKNDCEISKIDKNKLLLILAKKSESYRSSDEHWLTTHMMAIILRAFISDASVDIMEEEKRKKIKLEVLRPAKEKALKAAPSNPADDILAMAPEKTVTPVLAIESSNPVAKVLAEKPLELKPPTDIKEEKVEEETVDFNTARERLSLFHSALPQASKAHQIKPNKITDAHLLLNAEYMMFTMLLGKAAKAKQQRENEKKLFEIYKAPPRQSIWKTENSNLATSALMISKFFKASVSEKEKTEKVNCPGIIL